MPTQFASLHISGCDEQVLASVVVLFEVIVWLVIIANCNNAKIIAAAMPPIQNKPLPPDDLFVEDGGGVAELAPWSRRFRIRRLLFIL